MFLRSRRFRIVLLLALASCRDPSDPGAAPGWAAPFVRLTVEEGGFCGPLIANCSTVATLLVSPPRLVFGPWGETGMMTVLRDDEFRDIKASIDDPDFRKLIVANKRQCGETFDANTTIELETATWKGTDPSARSCIIGAETAGVRHPYTEICDKVRTLRVRYFGEPPPPGPLGACISNKADQETCEVTRAPECHAMDGLWSETRKCLDGVPSPPL